MMRHILLFAALGCLCTLLAAEDNPVAAPQPAAQRPQLVGTGNPEKRPRLAICTFQLRNGRSATLAGREVSGRYLTDKLGEALNDALSQTRKFNLLDRAYNAEVRSMFAIAILMMSAAVPCIGALMAFLSASALTVPFLELMSEM